MLFSSLVFLFQFLPFVLLVYYGLLRKRKSRNVFLLIASLFFYAWGEPKFVFVMILSILANFGFGLLVVRYRGRGGREKAVMTAMVVFNLMFLGVFKYLDFFIHNLNHFAGTSIARVGIALPIGISFFTFQAMSYVIDVYREKAAAQKTPLAVGLYISLFPQLIAGPIVRYETVAEQIENRNENFGEFAYGVNRFLIGLGKKVLLANSLAIVADRAFDAAPNETLSAAMSVLGLVSYAFQIYYDFSGYSDMAIGLGRMFGFRFLENFRHPYSAGSVTEFWRRWHISLGSWFRDYVYIPLGGSREGGRVRTVCNLFVVWFLTGLWHGAGWNFIAWGLYFFVFIAVEKVTGLPERLARSSSSIRLGYRLFTTVVAIGSWALFRDDSLGQAVRYVRNMFCFNGNPLVDDLVILYFREYAAFLALGVVFSMPVMDWLENKARNSRYGPTTGYLFDIANAGIPMLIFLVSVAYLIRGVHNPFIYFNF